MGNIQILNDFFSPHEQIDRTLRIYTPDGYDPQGEKTYPVLYVFDGQNIFAHPQSATYDTWCINRTMEALVAQGKAEGWIIVGIDHLDDRLAEYSSWIGGRANLCADFLVNYLKPYIDRTYRTRTQAEWTGVMGASMGGLMTLYLGKTYPQVFGRLGALSPALMWGDRYMFSMWDHKTDHGSKILLYVGGAEQYSFSGVWLDYVPITRDFYHHLKNLGYGDRELHFHLAEGEIHHETGWQRQIPALLPWLLAPSPSSINL
jgi:predicted alpha/beta superfamily hydrolase